jgi:DNA-directed RNA polymerase subunit M/transcription elongation factor TFIIS
MNIYTNEPCPEDGTLLVATDDLGDGQYMAHCPNCGWATHVTEEQLIYS